MKTVVAVLLLVIVALPAWSQTAQEVYQQGLAAERSAGRLADAIALYQRALANAGSNRALAARALLRLGALYERQGVADARAAYDRLIRDYGEQSEAVTEARDRLRALDSRRASGGRVNVMREVWSGDWATALSKPSTDGRFLTFTDWTTGDLAIRDIQAGTSRRLTNKGPWSASSAFAEQSVFSPDGREIAYSWYADRTRDNSYELRVVSTSGGAARMIEVKNLVYVQPWAWTPDGRSILAAIELTNRRYVIGMIELDGTLRELAPLHWRWTTSASISPDSKWVVFDEGVGDGRQRDVKIVAVDGRSAPRTIVAHPSSDWHPIWTPDGTGIVFLSQRTGATVLWFQQVRDSSAVGAPRVVKADMGDAYPIGFSRDGTFFLSPAIPTTDIVVADVDVDAMRMSAPRSVTRTSAGQNVEPDWSPDGESLVYVSLRGSRTGLPGERFLATLNLETGAQGEYDLGLPRIQRPRWSPDGRSIIFAGSERTTEEQRYVLLDLPSERTRKINPDVLATGPFAVLNTGGAILHVITDSTGRSSIRRMDVTSGATAPVHDVGAGFTVTSSIAVSRDDSLLALSLLVRQPGSRKPVLRIVRMHDGAVVREIPAPGLSQFANLNWTADRRHLLAVIANDSTGLSRRELWAIPADGAPPRKFDFTARVLNTLRVSPDGKRVVFVVDDPNRGTPSIWAAERLMPPAAPSRR